MLCSSPRGDFFEGCLAADRSARGENLAVYFFGRGRADGVLVGVFSRPLVACESFTGDAAKGFYRRLFSGLSRKTAEPDRGKHFGGIAEDDGTDRNRGRFADRISPLFGDGDDGAGPAGCPGGSLDDRRFFLLRFPLSVPGAGPFSDPVGDGAAARLGLPPAGFLGGFKRFLSGRPLGIGRHRRALCSRLCFLHPGGVVGGPSVGLPKPRSVLSPFSVLAG